MKNRHQRISFSATILLTVFIITILSCSSQSVKKNKNYKDLLPAKVIITFNGANEFNEVVAKAPQATKMLKINSTNDQGKNNFSFDIDVTKYDDNNPFEEMEEFSIGKNSIYVNFLNKDYTFPCNLEPNLHTTVTLSVHYKVGEISNGDINISSKIDYNLNTTKVEKESQN
jgi:hypothetical protein